eukprot:6682380-Pyramimonas_sp.AAC.1
MGSPVPFRNISAVPPRSSVEPVSIPSSGGRQGSPSLDPMYLASSSASGCTVPLSFPSSSLKCTARGRRCDGRCD